jgi:hypothetical protein
MRTTLTLDIEYDPEMTDPEGLASALDRLLETALSTPDILEECGNPSLGEFLVLADPCECEQPGYFCSGVAGILAHVENGHLADEASVERCDQCQRYPSDEAALQRLIELGIAPRQSTGTATSTLKSAESLPREALVEIVARVQSLLYLDMDGQGREYWNPVKDWSGWDVCHAIQESLGQHGLAPEVEQEYAQSQEPSPGASLKELVAWAQSQGLSPEDLDDEIHDHAGVIAANLNNRGLSAQIEFVVQQLGSAAARELLTELVSDKAS